MFFVVFLSGVLLVFLVVRLGFDGCGCVALRVVGAWLLVFRSVVVVVIYLAGIWICGDFVFSEICVWLCAGFVGWVVLLLAWG